MTKTILITGGYGYIGSHIAVELLQAGHDIIVLDNCSNSKPGVGQSIDQITGKHHIFIGGDILDRSMRDEIFSKHAIDAVIHCAALKAVGVSCKQTHEYYRNNVTGTMELLDAMKRHGVKKILFSSSTTVYDTTLSVSPFEESFTRGGTQSPYGTTKVINELMFEDYAMHHGFEVVSLRYFNPIGAHSSGLIGEDPAQPPTTLLPIILQTLTGHRNELQVYGNTYNTPDGTCLRDYIHVMDVAKAHVLGVKRLIEHKSEVFEAINIGTGNPTSVLEMIHIVEEVTRMKVPWSFTDPRPGDVAIAYANTKKSEKLLAWTHEFTIHQAVHDARVFRSTHFG